MLRHRFYLLLALSFHLTYGTTQTFTPKYVAISSNARAYYEYLPIGYSPTSSKTYPLILSIHGAADLGNGTSTQLPLLLRSGPPSIINQGRFPVEFSINGTNYSFIVISPQFQSPPSAAEINGVINYVVQNYKVDLQRIYITGLSMGGGVVWDYASNQSAYANRLAAIVPVCGNSNPTTTKARVIATSNLPVWATHNDGDPTVPVSYTNNYVSYINAPPAPIPSAIKTIFNNNTHDAWTTTYDPSFRVNSLSIYEWMLQYSRPTSILNNQSPTANAGVDQTITLPVSTVTLSGSGSDPDGSIVSYSWSQVSGTTASISTPSSASTVISGLSTAGVRVFRLTVTDNLGSTRYDDVTITVNQVAGNSPPQVNAGVDQAISLPVSTATLSGTASDQDGSVVSVSWTFESGPATPVISAPSALTTAISGLTVAGSYTFRFSATDNSGSTSIDNVTIVVSPAVSSVRTINVNVYGNTIFNNSAWNNWNTVSSLVSPLLKYSDGTQSTVRSVLSAQTSYADNGPSYPVTMCPQQVGRDASHSNIVRYDTLKGLDNSKLYDLSLYASRSYAGQTTRFTVNGTSVDIATHNNYTNAARFTNLAPVNGMIIIRLTSLATFNYLNGFTLTEKTQSVSNGASVFSSTARFEDGLSSSFDFSVYPNPTTGEFKLNMKASQFEIISLKIFDISGRVIKSYSVSGGSQTITFGSEFKSGLYFAEMRVKNDRKIVKIVKLSN